MIVPTLTDTGRKRDGAPIWMLTEPLTYKDVTVPAGFETDLATSFCLGISSLIARPGDKRIWAAAAVHDYCLATNHPKANDYFSEILRLNGVTPWRRWLMVTFVRWWTV
jgi:hypothetical protein